MKTLTSFKQIIIGSSLGFTLLFAAFDLQASATEEVTNSSQNIEIRYGIEPQIPPQNENENLRPIDPTKDSSPNIYTSNLGFLILLAILGFLAGFILGKLDSSGNSSSNNNPNNNEGNDDNDDNDNDDDNDGGNGGGGTETETKFPHIPIVGASVGCVGGCGGGGC